MSYVDATGNVRVSVTEPAVFLLREGANSDPWRSPDRPTNSLRGAPAARVVRALIDMRPPWRVRELAQAADASLGSTSRTVDFWRGKRWSTAMTPERSLAALELRFAMPRAAPLGA